MNRDSRFSRSMRRLATAVVLPAMVAAIGGCAHPISIGPDIAKIERPAGAAPVDRSIGYYIAPELRDKPVTTPGGGGDSVTYAPYRDLEAAIYKMLGNVFSKVTILKSPSDRDAIAKESVRYLVTPEMTTNSSSASILTWPPTSFAIQLTSVITDASGRPVARTSVMGNGVAEFDEFKSDFSLAGKRAALDAILKMQDSLLRLPELRAP